LGQPVAALLSSLAKVEAQKISDRTKAGMARAKAKGKTDQLFLMLSIPQPFLSPEALSGHFGNKGIVVLGDVALLRFERQ